MTLSTATAFKIIVLIIEFLKKKYTKYSLGYLTRSPKLWLYSAYLTLKYIDNWNIFPALTITNNIKVKIHKSRGSVIKIRTRLIFESWLNEKGIIIFTLQENAAIIVDGDFIFGQGTKVFVSQSATLLLKGKLKESGSGITAHSVIMVKKYLEIGFDCIIAWNTFLTDCDWHNTKDKEHTKITIIGEHVWIGIGAKILKGVHIGKDSIITANTTVLQGTYPEKALISGNPGSIKKIGIPEWQRDMINMEGSH